MIDLLKLQALHNLSFNNCKQKNLCSERMFNCGFKHLKLRLENSDCRTHLHAWISIHLQLHCSCELGKDINSTQAL